MTPEQVAIQKAFSRVHWPRTPDKLAHAHWKLEEGLPITETYLKEHWCGDKGVKRIHKKKKKEEKPPLPMDMSFMFTVTSGAKVKASCPFLIKKPIITSEDILQAVATVSGVPVSNIRSPRKRKHESQARHVFVLLCKKHRRHLSLNVIGRYLNRHHTTILHYVRKRASKKTRGLMRECEQKMGVR